ncbi:hypothetical protein AB1Y20_012943 [Prymnesium parvum]|uniref:Uncharacterized protein n=1 Tax=Prymnesium parvum TaxID=97485 RepID=A0AB34IMW1_PRYPA
MWGTDVREPTGRCVCTTLLDRLDARQGESAKQDQDDASRPWIRFATPARSAPTPWHLAAIIRFSSCATTADVMHMLAITTILYSMAEGLRTCEATH